MRRRTTAGLATKRHDMTQNKKMIDETSTKKGHHYATNFMNADTKELLFGH